MSTPPFLSLSLNSLAERLQAVGEQPFRIRQIREWLFHKFVYDIDKMTNLPASTRSWLSSEFAGVLPPVDSQLWDPDKTLKIAFSLPDGAKVEAVAIPDDNALTFCLSSQCGCPIQCQFCRTGAMGLQRNLTHEEILTQVLLLLQHTGRKPTNIVFMGMGEPFMNRKEVFAAVDILTDPKGLGLATRRITISTIGVPRGIEHLAERPGEVNLAVSLHTVAQDMRDLLVPGARKYPLPLLRSSIEAYLRRTNRRITFEVVLLRGRNDQEHDALNLAQFCEGLLCHINLVPFNPFPGAPFEPSSTTQVKAFKSIIKKAGIAVTVRRSRGSTILAACGQLAGV